MKRLIRNIENIYAGIRIEDSKLKFDWKNDNIENDVILLSESMSGQYDTDGVQFVYGYHFNPNSTKRDRDTFRRFLKDLPQTDNLYSRDVDRFVEEAILTLDTYHNLYIRKESEIFETLQEAQEYADRLNEEMKFDHGDYCKQLYDIICKRYFSSF